MTPELQEAIEKCRTAALACHALTVELAAYLEELRELKVHHSLELQATRDRRVAEAREWRELAEAMRELIVKIEANERLNQSVLHLIGAEPTGEKEWKQGSEPRRQGRSSGRSNMLTRSVGSSG